MSKVLNLTRLLLHKRDASPPSCAVMMLGDILGLQFDYKEPDLGQMEHLTPEFRKISPMSTIPVLQDGDLTICESHAILKYLIRKYGGEKREKLYPSDCRTRAVIDQLMFYDAGVLFVRLKGIALPVLLQGLKRPSERHVAYIEESWSVVEAHLNNRSYIAADHLTVADLSLGTTTIAMQALHKLDSISVVEAGYHRPAHVLRRGVLFVTLKVVALPTYHKADIDKAWSVSEPSLLAATISPLTCLSVLHLLLWKLIHDLDSNGPPLSAQWLARLYEEELFKKINARSVSELSTLLNIFW